MKNHIIKRLACAAAALAVTATVQAGPITGGISLSGAMTFNNGNINTDTAFSSFSQVTVASVSGSYVTAGVALNTGVNMTPFQFNPFTSAIIPLWITQSGPSAEFDLLSITYLSQPGDDTLTLKGTGTLKLFGYDPTPGLWIFTAQGGAGTFSFSSSNGAHPVPDGGTTAILLGLALTALTFVRKSLV